MERAISQFGFLIPIIADQNGRIVVGDRRWAAAKKLKLEVGPVLKLSHLSDEQLRLFTILDNKLSEDGEWDLGELRAEFDELIDLSFDISFNIEDTGFSTAELDCLPVTKSEAGQEPEDDVPDVWSVPVSASGALWALGDHRLICASCREEQSFEQLLGAERAQMIFSDPPYNLPAKAISGNGKHQHGNFAMASGEMAPTEFTSFLCSSFELLAKFSIDGSIHYQCMDWRHMREMLEAGHAAYTELKNLVVWKKHSAGMGSFYRSHHELVFVWKNGSAPHINNFGLGETGRYRSNVWDYRGNAGFHGERSDELASHATVKPWSMVADAIRDCSKHGGIILDPFGGSGTTLIAAERTRRKARLIEIDPLYCDVTIRRWEKLTGKDAVLVQTGETFKELEDRANAQIPEAVAEDDFDEEAE